MSKPNGLQTLKKRIFDNAKTYLSEIEPERASRFERYLKQTNNLEVATKQLQGITITPKLDKWQNLIVDIAELEMQIIRVRNCLTMLKSESITDVTLDQWVDYHYRYWMILVDSMLSKAEQLVKHAIRYNSVPATPIEKDTLIKEYLKELMESKTAIKPLRGEVAHVGGSIQVLKKDGRVEKLIMVGGYDPELLFNSTGEFQNKWHRQMTIMSVNQINMVFGLCERLCLTLDWNDIE